MTSEESPKPWERTASEHGQDLFLFRPRWDTCINPRTDESMKRLVLETRSWVNVVAQLKSGRYLAVRQYRFGTERVTTEIPGGVIDPGETPIEAATRELREETGCVAETWTELGKVEPNPAFHDNHCTHFLATGCRRVGELDQDPGEDLQVVELTEQELIDGVRQGEINHSLVLSALCRVLDLRG